jgi:hypothetical protein
LIHDGRTYALEIKTDTGRLVIGTGGHARLEAAGATVVVACGLDEAVRQMEAWGLLRGRTA